MRIKWVGVASGLLLVIACFMTWVYIVSREITVTGVNATGTTLGKPGYFHLLMVVFFIPFTLIPKIWAKRANLLVTALNLAWAFRNFLVVPACSGGECPEKHAGLYLSLVASILMLLTAMLPDLGKQRSR
jgi:hypothetical protein